MNTSEPEAMKDLRPALCFPFSEWGEAAVAAGEARRRWSWLREGSGATMATWGQAPSLWKRIGGSSWQQSGVFSNRLNAAPADLTPWPFLLVIKMHKPEVSTFKQDTKGSQDWGVNESRRNFYHIRTNNVWTEPPTPEQDERHIWEYRNILQP